MIKGSGPKKKYIKKLEAYRAELVLARNELSPERMALVKRKVNKYVRLLGYQGKEQITPTI
jgi:hypothetical protein